MRKSLDQIYSESQGQPAPQERTPLSEVSTEGIPWSEALGGLRPDRLAISFGKNAWGVITAIPGLPGLLKGLAGEILTANPAAVPGQGLTASRMGELTEGMDFSKTPMLAAIAEDYKSRYGSLEGLKETLRDDPVSYLVDVLPTLQGLGKAGKLGKWSKAAENIAKYANPEALPGELWNLIPGKPGSGYNPEMTVQFGRNPDGSPMMSTEQVATIAEQILGEGQGTSRGDVPATILADSGHAQVVEAVQMHTPGSVEEAARGRFDVSKAGIEQHQRDLVRPTGVSPGYDPFDTIAAGDQVIKNFRDTQLGLRSQNRAAFDALEEFTYEAVEGEPFTARPLMDREVPPATSMIEVYQTPDIGEPATRAPAPQPTPQPAPRGTGPVTLDERHTRLAAALDPYYENLKSWGDQRVYTKKESDDYIRGLANEMENPSKADKAKHKKWFLAIEDNLNLGQKLELYDLLEINLTDNQKNKVFGGRTDAELQGYRDQLSGTQTPEASQAPSVPDDENINKVMNEIHPEIAGFESVPVGYLPYFEQTSRALLELKQSMGSKLLSNKDLEKTATIIGEVIQTAEAKGFTIRDFDRMRTNFRQQMDLAMRNGEVTPTGSGTVASKMYAALTEDMYTMMEKVAPQLGLPDEFVQQVRAAKLEYRNIVAQEQTKVGKFLIKNQANPRRIVDAILTGDLIANGQDFSSLYMLIGEQGMRDLRPALLSRLFDNALSGDNWVPTGLRREIAKINNANKNKLRLLFDDAGAKALSELAAFSARFGREGRGRTGTITSFVNRLSASRGVIGGVSLAELGYILNYGGMNLQTTGVAAAIGLVGVLGVKTSEAWRNSPNGRRSLLEGGLQFGDVVVDANAIDTAIGYLKTATQAAVATERRRQRGQKKQRTRMGGAQQMRVQ